MVPPPCLWDKLHIIESITICKMYGNMSRPKPATKEAIPMASALTIVGINSLAYTYRTANDDATENFPNMAKPTTTQGELPLRNK